MAPRLSPFMRTSTVTNPRQLAPTMGLSHDGFKFLEGNFEGLKGYAVAGRPRVIAANSTSMIQAGAQRPAQSSTGTGSPLVAYTSSLARSANRALSWTSAPTSSRQLSVRGLPGLNQP